MVEELDNLHKIGADKISQVTHIPIQHIRAILDGSFHGFSRIQFVGFISILEREYGVSLQATKAAGLDSLQQSSTEPEEKGMFVLPEKKKNNKFIYIALIVIIFIAVVSFSAGGSSDAIEDKHEVNNTLINSVVQELNTSEDQTQENNTTDELNTTQSREPKLAALEKTQEEGIEKSFKILAKSKVWLGYINVKTNKKHQKIFSKEIELDPNTEWILKFGHAYIDMYINGKLEKFPGRKDIHFHYKQGKLTTITLKEFKRLNRGRKW